mgnify:CR=1 FL=1
MSPQKVGQLLSASGYSLQATQKTLAGKAHPDRNAQFDFINDRVDAVHSRGAPVISVDTKKKELVGAFQNKGSEWQPSQDPVPVPVPVRVHDFIDDALGKVIPSGVYDLSRNTGWVNVGIDHDTPAFAVASIARWWRHLGKKTYPDVQELLITADAGGSNSARPALEGGAATSRGPYGARHQRLAFSPGDLEMAQDRASLFCHLSEDWRGRPLVDHETVV